LHHSSETFPNNYRRQKQNIIIFPVIPDSSLLISLLVCLAFASTPALAGGFKKSRGQTVYAPANHNCYFPWPPPEDRMLWNCTLSVNTRLFIRNVDLNHSITVTEINLHDPDGDFIFEFPGVPFEIPPLASWNYALQGQPGGGVPPYWTVFTEGAPSYILRWTAKGPVHPPIISTSHAVVNRTPGPSLNPISLEGLTVTPGRVLTEDRRQKR